MPLSDASFSVLPLTEDYKDLYENAPCGYLSLGADGRIIRSNQTLSRWTGYSPKQLLGKHLRELLTVAGGIFYETHFAPLLRMQGFFDEVALDLVTADGEVLAVLTNAVEQHDANGALISTRMTILRATERRLYERELVQARQKAEYGLEAEREVAELRSCGSNSSPFLVMTCAILWQEYYQGCAASRRKGLIAGRRRSSV